MTDEYGRRMTPEMYLSRVEQLKSYEPGMDIWALSCSFARRIDPLGLTLPPLPGERCNPVVRSLEA